MKNFILLLTAMVFLTGLKISAFSQDFLFNSTEKYQNVRVKKLIRADIIQLEDGELIKLIGLKAPEPPKQRIEEKQRDEYGFIIVPENPERSIEEQAFDFSRYLLEGKHIRVEFDKSKRNELFETVGYVFLIEDNTFANSEILRHGFANLSIRPPNTKYAELLRKAYQEARREKRGLQGQ